MPRYPDILLSAGYGGDVRVGYTIDSTGHVVPGSLAIERSSHELFSASVRTTFPKWTFVPALVRGRPTAVRYEEVFAFWASKELGAGAGELTVVARDSVEGGVPRTIIGMPARDPLAEKFFTEDDLLAAQRSVLALLAQETTHRDSSRTGAVTLCVTVRHEGAARPADAETLRELSSPGRPAVVPKECPRTYGSMIYNPNDRPPKGWVDPFSLTVTEAEGWSRQIVRVWADLHQGTGSEHFRCSVTRDGQAWKAACSLNSTSLS
jgi:TonB family protein